MQPKRLHDIPWGIVMPMSSCAEFKQPFFQQHAPLLLPQYVLHRTTQSAQHFISNLMKTSLPKLLSAFICLLLALSTFSQTTSTTTFNYSGSIVTYTVPAGVTKLTITAKGAQGGGGVSRGGLGASMQGDFTVTPGQVLRILVGGQGAIYNSYNYSGGGGTFVTDNANQPLIVAGGGGGASCSVNGLPGVTGQNGTSGNGGAKTNLDGGGGLNGGGGGGSANTNDSYGPGGGGGGGFYGNGGRGISVDGFFCSNSSSSANGGSGGNATNGADAVNTGLYCSIQAYSYSANGFISGGQQAAYGSFGGGGAVSGYYSSCSIGSSGGGGGYSGGGGASQNRPGGGGGSFNNGINQINSSGVQTGNGQVVIVAQLPTPATALKFDPSLAVNDNSRLNYVSVNNPYQAFQKEITVEFWMNTPEANLQFGSVMGQGTSNVDDNWVWLMHPNRNGTMTFYIVYNGGFKTVTCNIRPNEWHHYAATASATSTKFYVDGVKVDETTGVPANILSNSSSVIHIGKDVRYATRNIANDDPTNRYAPMTIDELRIWSRALCQEEINANKNVEINPTGQNGLQHYYRFNQGFVDGNNTTVTTLTDLSGNNRNGTLNNFTLNGTSSNWTASGSTNTGIVNAFVPPTAQILGGTSFCTGQSPTLTNAIAGGTWKSSNTGVATINANTGQITTVSAGSTTITYTTACGGVSTSTVTINQLPTVTIAAVGGTSACPGSSVTLNATAPNGSTYQWFKDAVLINGASGASYNATTSGSYTSVVTNGGCVSAVSNAVVITISDVTKPTISCPPNQTLNLDATCKAILPDYRSLLTVNDNCTPAGSLVITQSPAAGSEVNDKGAMIVAFTVRDASGNESICTISVDKKDVSAPVITCPAPIITNNTPNTCGAVVTFINPTATDNCTGGAFNFWSASEPNNYLGLNEDYVQLYNNGTWNDLPNSSLNRWIVEFNDIRSNVYSGYSLIGTHGGHTYYYSTATATWTSARSAAQSIGGDLASINTLAESSFLAPYGGNTWVGGYQDKNVPGFQEPGNASQNFLGWKWVDGTQLGAGQITITQTAGLPSGSVFPIGVTTNTFIARDESGNESTCSFTVTVNAPEIQLKGNNVDITSGDLTPSVNDHTDLGGTTPGTAISKTYQITNTGTAALVVSSIGISNPNFVRSGITLPITINPGQSSSFTISFNSSTVGVQTATVTINNNDCNEAAYSFGIRAEITCTNPVFSNVNLYLQESTSANSCDAVVNYPLSVSGVPTPNVTYTFTGATTGSGSGTGSGQVFNKGITRVVVNATNACTTATASFDVTVVDDVKPVMATKNHTVYLNASGQATITPANVDNGSSDNCGPVTLSLLNTGVICATAAEGSSITLQAPAGAVITSINFASYGTPTGSCGNFVLGSCHAANSKTIVEGLALGRNSVTISATNGVFGDPCGGTVKRLYVSATYSGGSVPTNTFDCSKVGENTVTLIATDENGNTNSSTAVVTVVDNIKPNVITRNISVQLNQSGVATITPAQINNGSTDNCTISSFTLDKTSFTCENLGNNTVTLTVTDVNGNSESATAVVTVVDNILPQITAPANINQQTDAGLCTATVNLGSPVVSDNCSTVTPTNNAPSVFPVGTTIVTWTVRDAAGNTRTATQSVTITDNEKPTISVANINVNNDAGTCGASIAIAQPTTADNCGVASVMGERSDNQLLTADYPVGTTTITWTVRDVNGNSVSTTQAIVVTDNEKPTISVSNINVNNDAGKCGASITIAQPITADNCGVASVMGERSDNQLLTADYPVGTTTITWTVRDVNGNSVSTTQTIVVTDNEKPTISATNLNVSNDAGKCGASITIAAPNTSDNCGVANVDGVRSDNASLSAEYPVGTTTITWTVRDVNGNTNTTTQIIVVNDTELPVVKTQNIVIQLAANGQASITTAQINNGSTDNCAIATIVLDKVNFNCSNVGENTVVLTVTDIHGNSASANSIVTVQDNIAPTVITRPVTVTLVNGTVTITAAQVNNGSFDNCGIASMTVSPANFNCNNIGSNTVILTVTDVNGNTNSRTAIVSVVGQLPSCSITSVPTSNVFTGGNPNNIYLGYGAQSTVLNVAATGGSSYTYQWSGSALQMLSSATAAAPVFTPTAPGNYTFTVTVTNNFGCTSTCSITICVKDIRVPGTGLKGSPAKVYICHLPPGNKSNPQTLEISVNAVSTHIGQHSGDRLGTCAMTPCAEPTPTTVSNALISKAVIEHDSKAETNEELKVTVMPNPSATYFTLKLESKYDVPVNMRVMDAHGRVLDIKAKLGSNATVEIGHNYNAGSYFAEFIQGNRRKIVQLLKIR